jgi:hypothetical protein
MAITSSLSLHIYDGTSTDGTKITGGKIKNKRKENTAA